MVFFTLKTPFSLTIEVLFRWPRVGLGHFFLITRGISVSNPLHFLNPEQQTRVGVIFQQALS